MVGRGIKYGADRAAWKPFDRWKMNDPGGRSTNLEPTHDIFRKFDYNTPNNFRNNSKSIRLIDSLIDSEISAGNREESRAARYSFLTAVGDFVWQRFIVTRGCNYETVHPLSPIFESLSMSNEIRVQRNTGQLPIPICSRPFVRAPIRNCFVVSKSKIERAWNSIFIFRKWRMRRRLTTLISIRTVPCPREISVERKTGLSFNEFQNEIQLGRSIR